MTRAVMSTLWGPETQIVKIGAFLLQLSYAEVAVQRGSVRNEEFGTLVRRIVHMQESKGEHTHSCQVFSSNRDTLSSSSHLPQLPVGVQECPEKQG